MFALNTCEENGSRFVGTSSLSLFVVGFVAVAFGTEGGGNGELFDLLIFLNDFEFFVMDIGYDILLLSSQVVVISTHFAH
jgi:hypothetical protein